MANTIFDGAGSLVMTNAESINATGWAAGLEKLIYKRQLLHLEYKEKSMVLTMVGVIRKFSVSDPLQYLTCEV